MSEFEEALWLSAENWTDSFPTDLPKHKFSKKHNKVINDIIYGKQDKKIKLSKGTIKVLLIAAVLLAIATTAFAIPQSREYIVDKFSNHSEYNVVDKKKSKRVKSLNVKYIPAGFEKGALSVAFADLTESNMKKVTEILLLKNSNYQEA